MAKYCGIDEAGLGPILGPLSAAVCEVDFAPEELWRVFAELWLNIWSQPIENVANGENGTNKRKVADSKRIFRKSTDFAKLEQVALAIYVASLRSNQVSAQASNQVSAKFWAELCAGGLPAAAIFNEHERQQIKDCAWYRSILQESLPLKASRDGVRANAQHLEHCLREQTSSKNIRIHGELFCEKYYNQSIAQLDNKSLVLRELIGSLILNFVHNLQSSSILNTDVRSSQCVVDRLGGLKYYQPWLEGLLGQGLLFGPEISIIREEEHCSEYQIAQNGSSFGICFLVKGDQKNILCAVASIWAKYRRELLMHSFNQYWNSRGVSSKTSGYYQDAMVFLSELQDLFGTLPKDLQRSR